MKKRAKLLALLRYAMQDLEPEIIYTEKAFNEAVAKYTRDAALIRRELVDGGFADRKSDGSAYWLKESKND